MKLGYFLSSEEFGPTDLLWQARRAEQAGFAGLWISDHFHPWNDAQGDSPFVWGVIGGISQVTTRLPVTTAVTCPTVRIHPAIVAQAAATAAVMLEGRFTLGVGSGEALNEHILGDPWPPADVRLEMLDEAIDVMRELWTGEDVERYGEHYVVENARLYTLPELPPPVYVSGFGPKSISLAARVGDGYCSAVPDAGMVSRFRSEGGGDKPCQAGTKVCWGEDERAARRVAHQLWPTDSLPGELAQVLPTPAHFEQAATLVTEEMVAASIACGNDPERHLAQIRAFADAGYDELYVQQIGPEQEGFFRFYEQQILPHVP
ncbi:MAG: luciferase-like protein [Conexibacter sp.]|jgi:G6PDH family F420-dependent oxidoreductase|nr:luciferase-like protein [Conexibacter sp.]